ncbi:MAG: ArsR/SmtB family transcription factor [Candidatus Hodarchaeales archaeon]|jgi:DNA-binding transcriptional ArsR family regulator
MELGKNNSCWKLDPQTKKDWIKYLEEENEALKNEKGEHSSDQGEILKTLSHPMRLIILNQLQDGPNCVCELIKKLQVSNSALSYHLSYLAKNRLISSTYKGKYIFYYKTLFGDSMLDWLSQMPSF